MEALKRYLYSQVAAQQLSAQDAKILLKEIHDYTQHYHTKNKDVAIIGMACRFPGALNIEDYWYNLENGIDCTGDFPRNRRKTLENFLPNYMRPANIYRRGGYLEEIDRFDSTFFRISPKEAELMDPAQRLFLETIWETIEDAGMAGDKIAKSRTGVYVGKETTEPTLYKKMILEGDPLVMTGFNTSILASRISYFLDLKGPSMIVDTACSGSMIALHLAYQAVVNGEVDMALAGGLAIADFPTGIGMLEARDGILWAFDKNANGTVWGEGIAAILLKPLDLAIQDHDNIYAVIKGSAINNDGASNGITAPNAEAQADVIQRAWRLAEIDPETIQYIEAHGTGTKVGDPVEINGISMAFQRFTNKKQFCGVGTVKTNIGHLVSASGIASLIKMALALKKNKIPKSLNFTEPNPLINFTDSPVYVNDYPIDWVRGEVPRRCGVNSFGFSGTNGHMILEEAPWIEREPTRELKKHVFAISAKTEGSLQGLLIKYQRFLEKNRHVDLGDLCYTVNTGRGCYQYRVAIIMGDLQELIGKIKQTLLFLTNKTTENIPGVYFGGFQVNTSPNETSTQRVAEVDPSSLEKIFNDFDKTINNDESQLELKFHEICKLYVDGVQVDWSNIYRKELYQTLSLPTYSFEPRRNWIEVKDRIDKDRIINKINGGDFYRKLDIPLIDKCNAKTVSECSYVTLFNPEENWVLKEHACFELFLMPAVVYIEMAIGTGSNYFSHQVTTLKNINFGSLVVFEKYDELQVQTVVREKDGHCFFEIFYFKDGFQVKGQVEWENLSNGELLFSRKQPEQTYNLGQLGSRLTNKQSVNWEETGSYQYGPRWQNIKTIYSQGKEVLIEHEIAAEFNADFKVYTLHPAILDMATTGICHQFYPSIIFLPESVGEINIYQPISNRCYSYIQSFPQITPSSEYINFDVDILNEAGEVLVNIRDIKLKLVKDFIRLVKDIVFDRPVYYNSKWIFKPIEDQAPKDSGGILIIKDGKGIGERIASVFRDEGKTVITAGLGDSFQKIRPDQFIINNSEQAYEKLFQEIRSSNISTIIYLQAITNEAAIDSLEQLNQQMKIGVFSLFFLVRAIFKSTITHEVEIVLISETAHDVNQTEKRIHPQQAAMIGLGIGISQEHFNIKCRSIDIDEDTKIDTIIRELKTEKDYYKTAYRNDQRYVAILDQTNIEDYPEKRIQFKDQGVYIITGGTGAIGLEISKYLASQNKVNLALINRSKLPPRSEWDTLIDYSSKFKLGAKLRNIKEIEQKGSQVICYSADVSSYQEMKHVVEDLRKKYGKINGVIHSAGLPGDTFLVNKTEDEVSKVMAPKIQGTWILDQLTQEDELDFFILCSSISSFLAGIGQSDYGAANCYLDSFAEYRNKTGKKTLAINWPAWREVGMAVEAGSNMDLIFYGISNGQAIHSLAKVITRNIPKIVIGQLNFYDDNLLDNKFGIKPSETIVDKIQKRQIKKTEKLFEDDQDQSVTFKILGKNAVELSETEKIIAKIWGEAFGLSEINVFDDFHKLGGDSILAMRILNEVTAKLHKKVSFRDLIEYSTITDFSHYLDETNYSLEDNSSGKVLLSTQEQTKYDLSHYQRSIWLLQKYQPELTGYNLPVQLFIDLQLDVDKFQGAIDTFMQRHGILRNVITEDNGIPKQIPLNDLQITVDVIDLSDEADNEALLERKLHEKAQNQLDLSKPFEKVWLYKIAKDRFCVFLNLHQIIFDEPSIAILTHELTEIYTAYLNEREPDLKLTKSDYFDWIEKQQNWLESDIAQQIKDNWLKELNQPLPILNLPLDFSLPAIQTFKGSHLFGKVNKEDLTNLKKVSRDTNLSWPVIFISAYSLLLNKVTQTEDIIIGMPLIRRDHPEFENVIGPFVNMVCIRVNFNDIHTVDELFSYVQDKYTFASKNGDYPLNLLVEEIHTKRDPGRNPIFSTTFQVLTKVPLDQDAIKTDIDITLVEKEDTIEVIMAYNKDLFNQDTMKKMKDDFLHIIKTLIHNTNPNIDDIQLSNNYQTVKSDIGEINFEF